MSIDYEARSKEYGFALKETILNLVESHIQTKAKAPLFLDVRTQAEIAEAPLLLHHISVVNIPVSVSDTSLLEASIDKMFPDKQG